MPVREDLNSFKMLTLMKAIKVIMVMCVGFSYTLPYDIQYTFGVKKKKVDLQGK